MNTDPGRSPSIVTSIADWGNLFKGRVGPVCVNKFSINPSSQYRYSFMSESEKCRAWARRGRTTGGSPDVRISDPNQEWSRCVPLARGKGPASAGRGSPPGSRRIDVYSYKVPARPEAKSALQGRVPAYTPRADFLGRAVHWGLFSRRPGLLPLRISKRFLRPLPTCEKCQGI